MKQESNSHLIQMGTPFLLRDSLIFETMLYFSFVTLTTLGYGDITPATISLQSFAALEAVMGQLFIATVIARLIALMQRPNA